MNTQEILSIMIVIATADKLKLQNRLTLRYHSWAIQLVTSTDQTIATKKKK